jgi:drug/metabolite transporter (DMT)-like permease
VTAILLALGAALAYGASDFLGGRASTRAHFSLVTVVGAGTALIIALVAAALVGGTLSGTPLVWGLVSGLGSGFGTLFLYRGLARARVAVVAPTSGVLAAAMPAGLAVVLGERPAPLAVVGLVIALPAVWLISGGAGGSREEGRPSGVIDGVLAGFGFGLLFFALDRAGDVAGLWPLAFGQATGFALVIVVALKSSGAVPQSAITPPLPAESGRGPDLEIEPESRPWWPMAVATGVLASVATLLFYASTTTGLLTIAAVLTSLYPAGTIVLARLVLDERISRRQGLGLALAGCAVVLITLG